MIDPVTITTTATAIAAVIFSKATEKSGEKLGQAVFNKIGQIISAVQGKFKGDENLILCFSPINCLNSNSG